MRLILVLHCIVLWEVFVIVSPIIIARLVVIVVYSLFSLFATLIVVCHRVGHGFDWVG